MFRVLTVGLLAAALLSCGAVPRSGSLTSSEGWTPPISQAEFERLRSLDRDNINRRLAVQVDEIRRSALRLRGHEGVHEYLQGCDLSTPIWQRRQAIISAALEADDYTHFIRVSQTAAGQQMSARLNEVSRRPTLAAQLVERYELDQSARYELERTLQSIDPLIADATFAEKFAQMCEIDLANASWLQSASVTGYVDGLTNVEQIDMVYGLAMHADHAPGLQFSLATLLSNKVLSGSRSEYPLRLRDRALVNLGRHQEFGTLILCEAGSPVLAGGGEVSVMNANRARNRMPAIDLEGMKRRGQCS